MPNLAKKVESANEEAMRRMRESLPVLVGVQRAGDVIPGMMRELILHAGPPIDWDRMCFPQRNAACGAAVYEGLARTVDEAAQRIAEGNIFVAPCHEHGAVGSMCGVVSFSMPVFVVENKPYGNKAYSTLYESPGREKLSYGSYNERVQKNLKWLEEILAPILDKVIRSAPELDLRALISRALSMGDECHSRNIAGTALFSLTLGSYLMDSNVGRREAAEVMQFLRESSQFFLHPVMAGCKAIADASTGIDYSTIVTTLARNGVEFGIRVSGLGNLWFTGPAPPITGAFFPGFGPEDSIPDIGDSAITETVGLGAFSHAASPGLALLRGETFRSALSLVEEMRLITSAESPHFTVPYLDGHGAPVGIDIRRVVKTGITPVVNTAMADRRGRGQIGVGSARAPLSPFENALLAFAERYGVSEPGVA